MNLPHLGRIVLLAVNATAALGGVCADWNRTHLFNPKWPPHAKFHDGMSISMGIMLGALGIFALERQGGDPMDNLRWAALCPGVFFLAMATAAAYPNADTIDAEFPQWPRIGRLCLNEIPFAIALLAFDAGGWLAASSG